MWVSLHLDLRHPIGVGRTKHLRAGAVKSAGNLPSTCPGQGAALPSFVLDPKGRVAQLARAPGRMLAKAVHSRGSQVRVLPLPLPPNREDTWCFSSTIPDSGTY